MHCALRIQSLPDMAFCSCWMLIKFSILPIVYFSYSLADFRIKKKKKNSGSLVAVEGHRQTPKKHTSKPLIGFLCVSYIQTALNLAISLLREYQYVNAQRFAVVCMSCFVFLLSRSPQKHRSESDDSQFRHRRDFI